MISLEMIKDASSVLSGVARKTDILRAPRLFPNEDVYLKCENLQTTGSFKLRGAYYKMSKLTDAEKKRGVVACSAGNHAQGVALAAQKHNIDAIICMPEGAPISKIESVKSYGVNVELINGNYDDAAAFAINLAKETGRVLIHPFDDYEVMAGQATVAEEILSEFPDVGNIIVPVGGGGLISGIAYYVKQIKPECKVYGVQAAGAHAFMSSFNLNTIVTTDKVSTIADGIAVKRPGDFTFEMVKSYVDGIVSVSDEQIASAILALMENQKIVTEGAGAASVAALMCDKIALDGKQTICVVSGGNIDVNILSKVVDRGLCMQGRFVSLEVEVLDKPKQLAAVTELISRIGANVFAVEHDRLSDKTDLNHCIVRFDLETKNNDHVYELICELKAAGFGVTRL